MDFSKVKSITIPEGKVKSITCGGVVLWKVPENKKNWVLYSTEADGKTIYNGGKGYKDGYRVRSAGAEAENPDATVTGYIPYRKGDKLYIYPPFIGRNTENTVNFYNGEFACLGQITDSGSLHGICTAAFKTTVVGGVSVLDLSAVTVSGVNDIAYVRIGNFIMYESPIRSGAEMVITMDQQPYRNWLPLSTDASGNPFNGGKGYKFGYRLNSSGAETAMSNCFVTGFIPIKNSDTLRIKPFAKGKLANFGYSGIYIALYNSSYTKLSSTNGTALKTLGEMDDSTGIYTVKASDIANNSNNAFVRVSTNLFDTSVEADGEKLIVTVNEEIV